MMPVMTEINCDSYNSKFFFTFDSQASSSGCIILTLRKLASSIESDECYLLNINYELTQGPEPVLAPVLIVPLALKRNWE